MLVNSENLTALGVSFNAAFQNGFDAPKIHWPQIATEIISTTAANEYGWLGDFPAMREWIGDRVIKQLAAHRYTIKNKSFEVTVGVKTDDISDDNVGIYTPMFTEMGRSAAVHPDQMVFDLLKAGFTETCFDGQFYFDTDHPVIVNGAEISVSNMTAGASNPWFLMDSSRALKPLIYQNRKSYEFNSIDKPDDERVFIKKEILHGVDGRGNAGFGFWQMAHGSKATLDQAGFRAAYNAMVALNNDEGRPLGIAPNILVVGASNLFAARDVLLKENNANGETNTDRNMVEIVQVPWLP